LEQQSVLAVHAVVGPLQKVGEAHEPPLQTPEQQTPPVVVLQAAAVSRQVLPGPPSLPPSTPPSSGRLSSAGGGPPQLQAPNVYPITRAAKNTRSGFLILLLHRPLLSNQTTIPEVTSTRIMRDRRATHALSES